MRNLAASIIILFSTIVLFSSCEKENDFPKPPVATADTVDPVQLPVNVVTLTGSGKGENKIVGYLWSQVSGPGIAIIVSPSATTTLVQGLKAGDYVFQFAVIDEVGLTGVDTVVVKVTTSPILTNTYQPKNNVSEMTIAGNTYSVDLSDPNSTELAAATWTYNSADYGVRGLIKFDLSGIPQNATIISAKFSIFSHPKPLNGDQVNANSGSDNAFLIQRVTSTWHPAQVNWSKQPTTTATGQVEIPSTTQKFLDIADIDVTNLIGGMVSSNQNYGFMFRMKNNSLYTSRIFCSSKYTDASKHPKLVVTYKVN